MLLAILHHYLVWHYSRAYFEFFRIWMNLLWFVVHFFSLVTLTKSWLSPFKRITEERRKAWDLEDFAGRIIINLLSRIIGALIRTVIIVLGLLTLALTLLGGAFVYVVWIVAPALIVMLIIIGLAFILT